MDSESVLMSFHLGAPDSFLWALTRGGFQLCRLPGKSSLVEAISRFSNAVHVDQSEAISSGHALYQLLFGALEGSIAAKPRWILALDEQLFTLPFAALVVEQQHSGPVYLAERHSIQITSGALLLDTREPERWASSLSGPFIGIGDAIYNTADERWAPHIRASVSRGLWAAPSPARHSIPLARLAGSRREIEECARAWNRDGTATLLLRGADASRQGLQAAYRARPSVVHFATHVVQSVQPGQHGLIVLSLSESGHPEFLGPLEIAANPVNAGLIVLSGCSSGRDEVLPGEGLMGLTRAWLAAGARAVVASYWPAPDDGGGLFINFYRYLREAPQQGPAAALHRAQMDMLRAGGWRSRPEYWASYFVLANS
jgi:CHAT domain-containing protein